MSEEDIGFQLVKPPRHTTGKLYRPGREPEIKPYKSQLDSQREEYWSGPVVRSERRGLLKRLFNK